jgi:uncharacterized protein (DUF1800 family)
MLCTILAAALVAAPPVASPMGEREAVHLFRRTGFHAAAADVAVYARMGRGAAVDAILAQMTTTASQPLPSAVTSPLSFPAPDARDEAALIADVADAAGADTASLKAPGKALLARLGQKGMALKAWWMQELLSTSSPLTERVTLVFHDHFTSSLKKVRDPRLMARQNALFRTHAGGNYGELLHAVVDDGAMLRYLDASGSTKDAPNENLARELLELFTLGEGHYGEADVQAAARALTGRQVRRLDGEVVSRRRQRDHGTKVFLGVAGDLGPHQLVDRLLEHPKTAERITEALWVDLVSSDVDAARIKALADVLRDANYAMKPLLRALLLEDAFWDSPGGIVMGPVELVVAAAAESRDVLAAAGDDVDPVAADAIRGRCRPEQLVLAAKSMGQDLFDPPSVKGWPTGKAWVTTGTIAPRDRFVLALSRDLEDIGADDVAERLRGPEFQTR